MALPEYQVRFGSTDALGQSEMLVVSCVYVAQRREVSQASEQRGNRRQRSMPQFRDGCIRVGVHEILLSSHWAQPETVYPQYFRLIHSLLNTMAFALNIK